MVTFTGKDVTALFSHPAHQHGLRLVDTEKLFQCDGCRQLGDSRRYRCEQCDFDLHVCCCHAPASMEHSMFKGQTLTFFHSRPATRTAIAGSISFCDVCADPVQGFLYHNREHDLDLHPFCAVLPERIEDDGFVLELHKATGHNCGLCGKAGYRSHYLAYRFHDGDGELVYVHVACMLEFNHSGDNYVMQASSAATVSDRTLATVSDRTLATVQSVPRRRDKFVRVFKIAYRVGMFSHSVVTLNPFGVAASLAQ